MSRWPTVALVSTATHKGLVGGPFGSSLVGKDYVGSGVPVIRGTNLNGGRELRGDYVFVSSAKVASDLSRNTADPGDLVFTQRGTLGQVAVVPALPYSQYVVSQSQMRLRVDPEIASSDYLFYVCSAPSFRKQIDDNAIATGVPHINLGILARLEVPLPGIDEQRAIAQVLGALDDKIAADEQVAMTAIELGNSIFDRMHSASTVTRTQLGELVDRGGLVLGDGYRTKRLEHGQPGLRILRAGDVHDGLVDPVGDDFVSQSYARQIGPKMSQSGDIVMTTKGTVGRVAVVSSETERVVYSPQLCYFRVVENGTLDRGYLAAWFRSADLQYQASLRMFKSDMAPYINLQDIRSLEVPIVPFEQQREQGETQLTLLELFDGAMAESKRLVRLRDALLPELMSRMVRVKDAEQMVGDVV